MSEKPLDWVPEQKQRAALARISRPEKLRQVLNLYAQGAALRSMLETGAPLARVTNGIQRSSSRAEALSDLQEIEKTAIRLFDELVTDAVKGWLGDELLASLAHERARIAASSLVAGGLHAVPEDDG